MDDQAQKKLLDQLDLLAPYFEELILLLKGVKGLSEGIENASETFSEKIKSVVAEVVIPESVEVKEVNVDISKFRDVINEISEVLRKDVRESYPKEVTIKDAEKLAPKVNIKLEHLEEIKELLNKLIEKDVSELKLKANSSVSIANRKPEDAIPTKLVSVDNKFYDAIARVVTSGGSGGGGDKVYNIRVAVVSTTTYVGEAEPGTGAAGAGWRIRKIDESSGTVITWAGGTSEFNKVWDDRLSYTYS